ncbi:hypothetical protein BDV29DRAFT_182215, partial [Aspergillus leporis]
MPHVYSHDDNRIASSIEKRIHAIRSYRDALRSRRSSQQSQEILDNGLRESLVQEDLHDQQPTHIVAGFKAVHPEPEPTDQMKKTAGSFNDVEKPEE